MKKLLFFSLLLFIIFGITEVNASTNSFYDAEVIPNVYVGWEDDYNFKNDLLKVIRDSNTGEVAYCLEPFVDFNAGSFINNNDYGHFTDEQWERLNLIAYYGYGYGNHTDTKWFAITQVLIWREVMPLGKFYFTDGINGSVIEPFNREIEEIYNLVDKHLLKPSFDGVTFNIALGDTLTLNDSNKVLYKYRLSSHGSGNRLTSTNNSIEIIASKTGNYKVDFTLYNFNDQTPSFYYYSDSGQDIITRGKPININTSFSYNVIDTTLIINKLDVDTKSNINIYDSLLEGAVYHIYNNDMSFSREVVIDASKKIVIDDIPLGKYYIKETKAGNGYTINSNIYEVIIATDNPVIEVDLYNKRISRNISIIKTISDGVLSDYEKGIEFAIYDQNDVLYTTISTDDFGFASIDLTYGTYLFKQLNTTDGYYMVEDFFVVVNDSTDTISYDLVDFKIPVPDTSSTNNTYIIESLVFIVDKKRLFMYS